VEGILRLNTIHIELREPLPAGMQQYIIINILKVLLRPPDASIVLKPSPYAIVSQDIGRLYLRELQPGDKQPQEFGDREFELSLGVKGR
jgi:hypothetical protein